MQLRSWFCRSAAMSLCIAALTSSASCAPPCSSPIAYRVGELDGRFRITRNELIGALRRAEKIWEDQTERNLFRYDEEAAMPVNLVYDERQMTAQANAERLSTIDRANSTGEQLKRKLDAAAKEYEEVKRDYLSAKAEHDAEVDAHNQNVRNWNARGGAPPAEHAAIGREASRLSRAAAALEEKRQRINDNADRANELRDRYNAVAHKVNENIEAINTTAGIEFKQGIYRRDSSGERIDIYEYTDMSDLVHVLAHELGHALGLGHNDNPASIMYGKSATDTVRLTPEDIADLDQLCGGA